MKSILVIDDNDDVRSIVTNVHAQFWICGARGHQRRNRHSNGPGQEAGLDHQRRAHAGDDGHHLLNAIRELQSTATIPFILMTGSGSHDDFRRGMVSGADDYLQKPFTPDELIEAVLSRLIRQTDLEMEAYNQANRMRPGRPMVLPSGASSRWRANCTPHREQFIKGRTQGGAGLGRGGLRNWPALRPAEAAISKPLRAFPCRA